MQKPLLKIHLPILSFKSGIVFPFLTEKKRAETNAEREDSIKTWI